MLDSGSMISPEDEKSGRRSNMVLSVIKALQLLETLASASAGLALGDLSRRNDLHPSTAHRLLHTLVEAGYVRQDPTDRNYHLGSGSLNLAASAARHLDTAKIAAPLLRQLADSSQETAGLVVLDGSDAIYVAQAESNNTVRTSNSIGARLPAYANAGGKVLLAHLPPKQLTELLGETSLPSFTGNTLTDLDALHVEFERIRRRGYAVDDEEYESGMRCVAAIVHDHSGAAVASVILSGPSTRITISRLGDLVQQVQQVAREISRSLGWRR